MRTRQPIATGVDTIVGIATPPGAGALGVIRLSGPDALVIAGTLLDPKAALERHPTHTLRRVVLIDRETGASIDEAMCAVMRAPRSYTGEDVVELSCHGSPALLGVVVDKLCRAGARAAAPGEFTRRAFVNGRIDLARAEAVALLIGARTARAAALAARALVGGLSAHATALREALIDVIAGLEVSLDFPEDDVGIDAAAARARVAIVLDDATEAVRAARRGRLVHEGVTAALVGRPNAGKSSLLNALLGRERAIVAPTPGTTRDVVEGALSIDGVLVRLLDTAGLATPDDAVEAEGMKRTRAAIAESDVVILVVDGSITTSDDDAIRTEIDRRCIEVRSKSDLSPHHDPRSAGAIAISSRTGEGLPALMTRLTREIRDIVGDDNEEGHLAASVRQLEALEDIRRALDSAQRALDTMPLEVALVDLRHALHATSGLLGIDVDDAVLDRIFASFCVGK